MDNNKKSKLLLGMILAIITVLIIGIIYQFVCIKKLEKKIDQMDSAVSYISSYYLVSK